MQRIVTVLRRIFLGGVLVLIIAVIGLGFYTRTESFRRILDVEARAAINRSIRGTLSWERMGGSLWNGLHVENLQLRYGDSVIFKAARAEIGYALLPLLWKRIELTRLVVTGPNLDLRKQTDGKWNVVEALSSGKPSTDPFNWTIVVGGIAVVGGEMTLRPRDGESELYWLRKLDFAGRVRMADEFNVDLERLTSWVDSPQAPQVYVNGGLAYRQTAQRESLTFEKFWLQNQRSSVMLTGAIKNFTDFDSDLQLTIRRLAAQDVARYISQWPAGIDVTGALSARGPSRDLAGKFDVRLARGQLSGTVHADLQSQSKPYRAEVAIRGLGLEPLLSGQKISGTVSANLKIAGAGSEIEALNGTGDARVQSLSVGSRNLGEVGLRATLRGVAAEVNGDIDGPIGLGKWSSQIRFSATPEYSAVLALRGINIARLLEWKDAPNGKLNFDAKINGAGVSLANMNSQAVIDVLPSQWDAVNIDQGNIIAQLSKGRVRIENLRLRAGSALLSAQGELGVAAPQSGQVNYQLNIPDLEPWLALVGRPGSGRLELSGRAEGNLARLQTQGSVHTRGLKLSEGGVAAARADFVLAGGAGTSMPSGTVNLSANDVRLGVDLADLRAALTLPAPPQQAIIVRLDAHDSAGRPQRLVAEIEKPQAEWLLRARELVLTLNDGPWRLEKPATVAQRGDDFYVDWISMRNGRAQIMAEGRFSLRGTQSLTMQANDIPLATLGAALPKGAELTGSVSAQARVNGTAALPEVETAMQFTGGRIAGQAYQSMRARADYRQQRIALDLTIEQDSAHKLEVRGTVPLALAWTPRWRAEPLPGMELRAHSAGLSLAFLNALKLPVENIVGRAAFDLVVSGSLAEPQPRGTFELIDGGFGLKNLGMRVTDVGVSGSAEASRLSFTRLAARSGSGALSGSGVLSLNKFVPQEFNLDLTARRWPAIQTERYSAVVDADLKIFGPLKAPAISGKAQVIEGNLRVPLGALERSPIALTRDPTIVVVKQRGGTPIATPRGQNSEGGEKSDLWRALAVTLTVTIPNNLWVRHPNATVELAGNLTVEKKPQSEPALIGVIETVRGWVGFQGRRFEIRRGLVQFNGGLPINPSIDAVGEYRVNNYVVSAVASGTANKPALTLTSQPSLEQSDILALLLFGKPIAELTSNEQFTLQQSAVDITAGFAAAQIGKAVSDALGLESLGDISFSGGQVRFGRYVGGKTYFSLSQEIAGKMGHEVSLGYQLTPQLRIDATTNASGNSGIDIIWHKRY